MSDTREVIARNRVAAPPLDTKLVPKEDIAASIRDIEAPLLALRPRDAVSLREVRGNERIRSYIEAANQQMAVIGYSEHGLRHAGLVASISRNILLGLGAEHRAAELAAIAGYLHDIGNCVHRIYHPQIGASMSFHLLEEMLMSAPEIALIIGAIGNHEEPEGIPINAITAAVIIADKSDVHFSRVQNPDPETYDIHDRVNHAVQKSHIVIDAIQKNISLELIIDISQATVMEYFEIFVDRMIMCRKAADLVGCKFRLIINGVEI